MKALLLDEAYAVQIASHREWLQGFDPWRRTAWESRLASDLEAAICEARVRELLVGLCDDIEPYEDQANGGPDFMIRADDEAFFVEVTSMSVAAVTAATGLPSDFEGAGFRGYTPLTQGMLNVARGKTRQLANLDRPALLFLCTLHGQASATISPPRSCRSRSSRARSMRRPARPAPLSTLRTSPSVHSCARTSSASARRAGPSLRSWRAGSE